MKTISTTWALAPLAELLHVSVKRVRNVLSAERAQFGPPMYTRDARHPRRVRLLPPRDIVVLCWLLGRPPVVSSPLLSRGEPRDARRRKRNHQSFLTRPAQSSRRPPLV